MKIWTIGSMEPLHLKYKEAWFVTSHTPCKVSRIMLNFLGYHFEISSLYLLYGTYFYIGGSLRSWFM